MIFTIIFFHFIEVFFVLMFMLAEVDIRPCRRDSFRFVWQWKPTYCSLLWCYFYNLMVNKVMISRIFIVLNKFLVSSKIQKFFYLKSQVFYQTMKTLRLTNRARVLVAARLPLHRDFVTWVFWSFETGPKCQKIYYCT